MITVRVNSVKPSPCCTELSNITTAASSSCHEHLLHVASMNRDKKENRTFFPGHYPSPPSLFLAALTVHILMKKMTLLPPFVWENFICVQNNLELPSTVGECLSQANAVHAPRSCRSRWVLNGSCEEEYYGGSF